MWEIILQQAAQEDTPAIRHSGVLAGGGGFFSYAATEWHKLTKCYKTSTARMRKHFTPSRKIQTCVKFIDIFYLASTDSLLEFPINSICLASDTYDIYHNERRL